MTDAAPRIGKRDIAIAAGLSLLGLWLMYENVRRLTDDTPATEDEQAVIHVGALLPFELAVPLFLLVTVPLLWRRVAPLAAVAAALAGLLVNEALLGSEFLRSGVVLLAAFVFAFTTGSELAARSAVAGLALSLGLALVDTLVAFGPLVAAIMSGLTVAFWGIGRLVRSRRQMADALATRTADLRQARDERARLEVATDRARLSRELEQLLERRLGELARLADAGTRPIDGADAAARLATIERESRRTLDEMRAAVGVLRNDDSELLTAPPPALTQLDALLVQTKGSDARLTVEGNPRVLPAATELSAYRIVEHLLSALEDAPDVEVCVRFGDDALELAVAGPARRGAKASIERARERARLLGGAVDATLQAGRVEARASLPALAVA